MSDSRLDARNEEEKFLLKLVPPSNSGLSCVDIIANRKTSLLRVMKAFIRVNPNIRSTPFDIYLRGVPLDPLAFVGDLNVVSGDQIDIVLLPLAPNSFLSIMLEERSAWTVVPDSTRHFDESNFSLRKTLLQSAPCA